MSVETELTKMTSFFLFLSLFFFIAHHGVDAAFLGEKPMIYINLFDEFVIDNSSSKFIDKEISSASTPTTFNSVKDERMKLDSSKDLLKGNDENKTSAYAPYDSLFEFDKPSKADITETSANESVTDSSTGRLTDLMDAEMLEPELNRIFFLKAITSLIEHIMEALFSIDETSKLNEPPSFDYDSAPSRKIKKRDLPSEGSIKPNDVVSTTEKISIIDLDIKSNADLLAEDVSGLKDPASPSNISPEFLIMYEFLKNTTEGNSQTPSPTLAPSHILPHHRVRKSKPHSSTEGHDAKSTVENSQHETEFYQERNLSEQKKHTPQTDVPKEPVLEEITKMIHFKKEKTVLNDDVVNKKDGHFYGGDQKYAVDDHDGYKFDEHLGDNEEEDYANELQESSSLVTVLLVSTTVMILLIFVAFGLAAAHLFRKNQAQSGNQNASNVHTAVA